MAVVDNVKKRNRKAFLRWLLGVFDAYLAAHPEFKNQLLRQLKFEPRSLEHKLSGKILECAAAYSKETGCNVNLNLRKDMPRIIRAIRRHFNGELALITR
jgi:hypothetical protein